MSTKSTKKTRGTEKAAAGKKTTAKRAPAKAAPKQVAKSVSGTLTLPAVGQKLVRAYHGKDHTVEVIEGGFKYQGETYTSLTALAKQITGYKAISGPAFFGLWKSAEGK